MDIAIKQPPVNRWDKDSIRPGPVGSVGSVNNSVRLRQSAPYLPMRYDPKFSGKNEPKSGANISDGNMKAYTSHGKVAEVIDKDMYRSRSHKTSVGWFHEDIRPTDRTRTAQMGSVGNYTWNTKVARIYRAKVTGEAFLPTPNGYSKPQNIVPRGSQYPQIVAQSEGTGMVLPPAEVKITDPTFGQNGSVPFPGGSHNVPNCDEPKYYGMYWTPSATDPIREAHGVPQWATNWIPGILWDTFPLDNEKLVQKVTTNPLGHGGGTIGRPGSYKAERIFSSCGHLGRPASYPIGTHPSPNPPIQVPTPGPGNPGAPPIVTPPVGAPPPAKGLNQRNFIRVQ